MTGITPATLLRGIAAAGLVIAWGWLAHAASAGKGDSNLAVAVASAPLLAIVVILLWRVGRKWWLIAGALAVVGTLAWHWQALRHNVALLYCLQHVGTNLALGLLFGRSLFGPGESLVTRFARLAHHGVLSDAQLRYTRQVTIAWTAFFGATAAVSTTLFLFAPPTVWSIFANLLTIPLLGLMFAAEYLVRQRVLPPAECAGIADSVRGYRETMRQRGSRASDR
jgi:uncharacterized membrane protein